jgi:single-strand DNA-binding protein
MNVLNVIGNVGKDSDLRATPNGKMVLNFSVAMESGWGDRKQTTWVNCSMWGDRGQKLQQYIVKGQKVGVTGECSLREWTSATKSGTSMELNVQNVTLCGEKKVHSGDGYSNPPQKEGTDASGAYQGENDFDDSIPF